MSILRDLDPQNARFSDSAAPSKSRKFLWAGMLLMVLAAATWQLLSFQSSNHITTYERLPELAATTKEPSPGVIQSVQPPLDSPKSGAALIQTSAPSSSDGKNEKNAGPNVFQTMQMELEKSRDEQVVAKTKQAETSPREKPQANAKQSTTASTRKTAASSTSSQSADNARQAKNTKTPKERDVEIISAIVK